ncbi:hypothetical protein FOA43_001147 [Brettanomyces nanus]|uniref:Uncharacterized protein n=1 Tax=Eeniella nana TaxID=13502 RepID=A0A875S149_EENNA|nr:uncharacterized protein FOA43_001147 [Brettanomyces nanus]QPG73832.1 hypothetical protein FOA43_001147 [Brettanomyces nanus]
MEQAPSEQHMEVGEPSSSLPPHLSEMGQGNYETSEGVQQQQEQSENITTEEIDDSAEVIHDDPTEPRPNALLLRGVESLDTRAIKYYVDAYVKPGYSFANRDLFAMFNYKLEWVNDESINIVFISGEQAPEGAQEALKRLTDDSVDLDSLTPTDERSAKPFQKEKDDKESNETADTGFVLAAPQPDDFRLTVRQSFYGDRKVKNARIYSRYYLMHGQPDKAERLPVAKDRMHGKRFGYHDYSKDLITGEEPEPELLTRDEEGHGILSGIRDSRHEIGVRRRNRGRGRGRERFRRYGDDRYRSSRDDGEYRREKADQDDLFPDFFKRKEEDREREQSPSRMDE